MSHAATLRSLLRPGDPVVLPNAWDPPSARRLAETGPAAIATTSAGVARAIGYDDGEVAPAAAMLAAVGRIAAAVELPVTADMESGYGLGARELADGLREAGACGLNFEDTDHSDGSLRDPAAQAERIAALREAAGDELVINARVDVFVRGGDDQDAAMADALVRGRLYREAGADSIYPIAVRGRARIGRLCRELEAPVNIMAVPGGLSRAELADLGVARISFGPTLMAVALDAAAAVASDF